VVHPANTLAVRMSLATMNTGVASPSFVKFASATVAKDGVLSLYSGLSAGITRQVFYATSRFGLYEVYRDAVMKMRGRSEASFATRLGVGLASGMSAALISCPAEVTLVRMSNDKNLPPERRRNYTSIVNAATRIVREEGVLAFWRGAVPFVQRAALVGACQVGTYDQFRMFYEDKLRVRRGGVLNTFCASMTAGLLYSLITMPFESAKNRMANQVKDEHGRLPYTSTSQTMRVVARTEGVLSLWTGFFPYYLRCGGHTVSMFIAVEALRSTYKKQMAL